MKINKYTIKDGIVTMELTQGKSVIFDVEDLPKVLAVGCWYYANGYAIHSINPGAIRMHRVIMGTPDGMETDHINGNRLDNRRTNLRVCTHAENLKNRGISIANTSGYKGVSFHKLVKKYEAHIVYNGKHMHLGYFDNPEDAATVYKFKAAELFGEFARKN